MALPNKSFCCEFFSFNTKFLHSSFPRKSYFRDPSVRIFWVISRTLARPSKIQNISKREDNFRTEPTPRSFPDCLLSFPGYNPLNPPGKILQYFEFVCHGHGLVFCPIMMTGQVSSLLKRSELYLV